MSDWREDICTAEEGAAALGIAQPTFSKVMAVMRVKPVGLARISSKRPTMLWRCDDIRLAYEEYQARRSPVRSHNWRVTMIQRLQNHYQVQADKRRGTHWTQKRGNDDGVV